MVYDFVFEDVKGFVKRCRSFKEDIISRLARNRSTGGADELAGGRNLSSHSGIASPSGWSSKSPTPGDESSVEPVTLISHRLKEVNLTLHFVESLIQKNCVELLGGSSNVMLDLMGCLFNDIKKMPSSDSAQFQSIISQLKTVLSDFLTAVDALLLKEGYDDSQRELYFEKVQESIATSRDALSGLRNLIDTRDTGSSNSNTLSITSSPFPAMKTGVLSQDFSSSGNLNSSTPLVKANNNTLAPPLSSASTLSSSTQSPIINSSPTRFSENSGTSNNVIVTPTPSTFNNCLASSTPVTEPEEKKPPLPPKSKQLSRRSFDSDWPDSITPTSVSAGPSSPRRMSNQTQQLSHSHQRFLSSQQQNINSSLVVAPAVSLDQWLEQSNCVSTSSSNVRMSVNNVQATSSMNSMNASNILVTSSSSSQHHQQQIFHQLNSSSGLLSTHQNNVQRGDSSLWINSAIYIGRSTHSTASDSKEQLKVSRNRTYSDSYQLDYEDNHLERLVTDYERRSVKSGTTHNSLSLSLGSSLDNLLLVDAQSQQSGLSPNSNTSGTGCTGAMHSLSGSSNHPSDATGRLTNFGDFEVDEDVFVTEVVDGCVTKPQSSLKYLPPPISRLSKQPPVEDDSDSEIPPVLPEKRRINKHFTIDHGYGVGESIYSSCCKQQHQPNARCYSPYDNVEDNDSILQLWHGGVASGSTVSGYKSQQQSFMTQSESRVTLVGTAGADSDEKPPLPPKKKHSLIAAYVEFMHNFDLHSHRQQHFCNHIAARNHLQEVISSSEDQPQLPHQGFHRPYLSERSATMFNPSTGEIPGFTGITSPVSSVAHTTFTNAHSGGGVNRAALYSASYHHFSTFSNSSIPSEENSPTHQHFPLTGSSSSTSHSLSDHASGNDNGAGSGGSGNETKPPLPPKKSRSILKSLLGELSNNSSQETEKSASNNNHGTGSPTNGATTPSSPAAGALPPKPIPSPVKPSTPTSPNAPNVTTIEQSAVANNATSPANEGGSSTKSPQRSLDEDSIDLFMIDPTPLLVINKKSSPHTSTSSSSNNQNQSSKTAATTTGDAPLEVKGAEPLVLLVYASNPDVVDTKFRETFLLTYRNFLRPTDVVTLLWKRFKHFENKTDRTSMIHARATLDVFVDVVIGLTPMDLDDEMVSRVRKCIYHLVCSGEIQSALKARKGVIHKYQVRLKILKPQPAPATLAVTTEAQSLLKWSATSIAQQMTLLDADLFRELEPAELLLWAREQVEDLCPALNNFTEHFNKVSYWTRTRVLMCSTSRERNRTMKKLIGVMRKLREYNNFNSLLAVLAALDSAPIRRLGFSRRLTEALKPHAALTDSSGSFRTYRQALADCSPPCIPYIGLVLQDLTFVHIGNPDFLTDGKVNWVKRLQQWVILEPIRRLHTCHYGFSRNDALLAFLNNFDEYLNDDDLWQLSESIKPQTKNN
ncbi:unnamed protein product [Orchesella dallaii]|uniref:Rap guanine nucleotide exchange factor 1 n=1 Tax=Orchesella dallaii TaxID=48710 RepID=A0ABP1Q3Z0_9HEXA